jgi:hypothetical protein
VKPVWGIQVKGPAGHSPHYEFPEVCSSALISLKLFSLHFLDYKMNTSVSQQNGLGYVTFGIVETEALYYPLFIFGQYQNYFSIYININMLLYIINKCNIILSGISSCILFV